MASREIDKVSAPGGKAEGWRFNRRAPAETVDNGACWCCAGAVDPA